MLQAIFQMTPDPKQTEQEMADRTILRRLTTPEETANKGSNLDLAHNFPK